MKPRMRKHAKETLDSRHSRISETVANMHTSDRDIEQPSCSMSGTCFGIAHSPSWDADCTD